MSSKPNQKLAFKKPSGESRLNESIKQEVIKEENMRLNFDIPKNLAISLKVKAAEEGTTMRELIIYAIQSIVK